MFALMTVNELYRSFLMELDVIYPRSEAVHICYLVFEDVAGISRQDMIKDPGRMLDQETTKQLSDCLVLLKTHAPVQYVTGNAWFYQMKLKVTADVLIPRPETEELVDTLIRYMEDKPTASILDIGTGSGCIAIAIKKHLPPATVTAIDISTGALAVAKENARQQKADINFIELDFLDESTWPSLQRFDVIVSNPPYIPENEKQILDKNVAAFEPHGALFVENGRPLIFYEKIAAFAKEQLEENGKIFMEIHESFAQETASLFTNEYFSALIKRDMQGKQRMLIANRRYP